MTAILFLVALAALVLSCFTATAGRALRGFSRVELEEICQARTGSLALCIEIVREQSRVALAVENLRVIFAAVVASTGSLWIWLMWGAGPQPQWPQLIAAGLLSGLALLTAVIWIPNAVVGVWAAPFVFRTWPLWKRVSRILAPLVLTAGLVSLLVHKAAGRTPEEPSEESVEEAIRSLVNEGHREGLLEEEAREMIEGVIELGDAAVRDIMTPRTQMISMPIDHSWDEALHLVIEAGHTRIPVYDKNRDDIVGVLYIKDLLPELAKPPGEARRPIAGILRKPFFVPETKPIDELLREFQRSRNHIAIVLDEFGGVSGLVSIEDVLEEIVGEIADEYDEALVDGIKRISDSTWEVLARVRIEEINERLGLALPEDSDFDTVGGFVLHEMGHVPAVGEEIVWRDVRIRVLDATRRRIDRVAIEAMRPSEQRSVVSGQRNGA